MQKIWNRPNQSVWSLATIDSSNIGNMNICTYVTSVSMKPKLMMVAMYHNTKTYKNVTTTKKAILQLLSEELAPVTRICGHLSGNTTDKLARIRKRYSIDTLHEIPFFTKSAGYMELTLQKIIPIGGDHDLAIFTVVSHKNLNDKKVLTTDYLRAKGLLR